MSSSMPRAYFKWRKLAVRSLWPIAWGHLSNHKKQESLGDSQARPRMLTATNQRQDVCWKPKGQLGGSSGLVWSILKTMSGERYKSGKFNSVFFGNKNNMNTDKTYIQLLPMFKPVASGGEGEKLCYFESVFENNQKLP